MLKTCKTCEETGEWGFLERDYFDELQEITFRCEDCGGTGVCEVPSTVVALKIIDKLGDCVDEIILDIEDTINRPNNPDVDDIVETYMKYNYGELVDYNYKTTKNKEVNCIVDEELDNILKYISVLNKIKSERR